MSGGKRVAACVLSTLVASIAGAAEPNETFGTRTILSPGVLTVTDVLTPGLSEQPDTLLGVRNLFGQIVFFDDDSSPVGSGTASGVEGVPTNSGVIDFSVTGFGDDFFEGSHGVSGDFEVFVRVFDFGDELIDEFSEIRTLEPGAIQDFTFSDFNWIGGSYEAFIDNTIGPVFGGDIDFFTFTGLSPGATFSAETLDPTSSSIDTLLGWFDSSGELLESDDDGAGDLLSLIEGVVPASGTLSFAVTGFEDVAFEGAHAEDDPYELRLAIGGGGFAADFNNDNRVTGADLAVWRGAFGTGLTADADNDSDGDGADFLLWQRQLGSGNIVAVPEPTTWVLLAAAAAPSWTRRLTQLCGRPASLTTRTD